MRSALSFVLFAAALYLVGATFFLNGPVSRTIRGLWTNPRSAPVARVGGREISHSQLDRAVAEALWRDAKSEEDLAPVVVAKLRVEVLDELIDEELLRAKTATATDLPSPTDAEIDARMKRFKARFPDQSSALTAMKSQGAGGEAELRGRIAAELSEEKFLDRTIAPAIAVTNAEAREWFTANEKAMSQPERLAARHVFLATLNRARDEVRQTLEQALIALTSGQKDFPALARELSEDPATKDSGGDLGWMTRSRLPADFSAAVFQLEPHQPTLIQTALGWHLVEVTDHKLAEPRTYESAKPEIIAALAAEKRQRAVADFRKSLRAEAKIHTAP